MVKLTLEEFEDLNYDELQCIFAETGADRELDFLWEDAVEVLYELDDIYPQLQREKMIRKFIVGDIHGCYDLFYEKLKEINFDFDNDIMYSVGDLVDRGPDSMKCLKLIKKPWFHAVCGNHEDMMIKALLYDDNVRLWLYNGGQWHLDEDRGELIELAKLAEELPYSITLEHENIGICHAEPPKDWNDARNPNEYQKQSMIWGRTVVYAYNEPNILNIGRTFHGHTITDSIKYRGNTNFIDTGAYSTGNLTCVEV